MEDLRIKLAVLWIVTWCSGILGPFLELYIPGYVEEIIAGFHDGIPVTPQMNLLIAFGMMIPLVMAFLSLTLKNKVNRWANIIMGTVYATLSLFDPIMYVAEQSAYSAYVILIGIVMFVFTALIVWYAWKSK